MDWQQWLVYLIVAGAALYLARGYFRKGKSGCGGCSAPRTGAGPGAPSGGATGCGAPSGHSSRESATPVKELIQLEPARRD